MVRAPDEDKDEVRPDCTQWRIGPNLGNEGKGASRSREMIV